MTKDRSWRAFASSSGIEWRLRYASSRPSGDHSYPKTPSGAEVTGRGADPSMGTIVTCGRPFTVVITDTRVLSGSHRNRGAVDGTLKILIASPIRFDAPPVAGTMNSAPSVSFVLRFGVEVT